MTYALGARSLAQLDAVHPRLRQVILRAIQTTPQDFMVVQGLRSEAEAKANTASGASRTTHSLHLRQPDGYAHAVDLGAWTGKLDYTDHLYWPIAAAVRQAALELHTTLRWGGAWDRRITPVGPLQLGGDMEAECRAYARRHAGSDLLDIGHFELPITPPAAA